MPSCLVKASTRSSIDVDPIASATEGEMRREGSSNSSVQAKTESSQDPQTLIIQRVASPLPATQKTTEMDCWSRLRKNCLGRS